MSSSLEDDLSCPVCCELYQDPQLLSCGHSFCRRCLNKHHAVNPARACPVCRQTSPQQPVANLALRNTCESYLKERERERESDVEVRCSLHGEKITFFCRAEAMLICSECRKYTHSLHSVQPLTHAVRQRKAQVKAALGPAEKALESLKNGTAQKPQLSKYIQSQAQRVEKLIKKEFEKFHQFLRDEEEARISAVKKEGDRKRKKVQEKIEREIQSLSERVKEVEEELENDGATFLQNFDYILLRAKYTEPDSQFGSEILINIPEHVGNLGYRVWQEMKDKVHYYPVLLDPNSASADLSVSDDLSSVGKSNHDRSIPIPLQGNRLVLGSTCFIGNGTHWWDVEVGDSKHWSLGVCLRSEETNLSFNSLNPHNGFWGMSRHGDSYRFLLPNSNSFQVKKKLRVVRLHLSWHISLGKPRAWHRQRLLSFIDADDDSMLAFIIVPPWVPLFPFLIPHDRSSRLRIAPVDVIHTVEHTLPLPTNEETRKHVLFAIILVIAMIVSFMFGMWMNT
ncbi:nuclear factor 7, brain-like [Astyanax mexicanus]|uniref:nuclear factor 7, brain-like n=1 Tax=Astyanax mexicanus TaxID=7994 RepID=UPI0020CADCAF|nr:nuclear factor 7, brain-like [Astyanax mexicanus]